jgi:hypothetical protein
MVQLSSVILGCEAYVAVGDVQDLIADVLVFDGVNHKIYANVLDLLMRWRGSKSRAHWVPHHVQQDPTRAYPYNQ